MNKIVVTGGAGFIGSHIVDFFSSKYPSAQMVVIDKMTYAADFKYLERHLASNNFTLKVGDICDKSLCDDALYKADLLIHAAAESHVDNSFESSLIFTQTNVLGTHTVMQSALKNSVAKILHISTDEVYGEVITGAAKEDSVFSPTNPYSASKAAAEMIVRGYMQSFGLPAMLIRANNMFGIRQFPEKLIPRSFMRLMTGNKIQLHGDGENKRTFLSVYDFCSALFLLTNEGKIGDAYNIGTEQEYKNVEVAKMICDLLGFEATEAITYVRDRPFNDARYSVDYSKIVDLGWEVTRDLTDELPLMADWYRQRISSFSSLL